MVSRRNLFILAIVVAAVMGASSSLSAQTVAPYVYEKTIGESVTVAWDHVPLTVRCKDGDPLKEFARGVNGSLVCGSVTYPVTWTANSVKVAKFGTNGTDWVGVFKYNYRGYWSRPRQKPKS